jgi:hypothetical protein
MTLSRRTFLTAAASLPLASCVPGIEPRAVQVALVPINAAEASAGAAARAFQVGEIARIFRVPPSKIAGIAQI